VLADFTKNRVKKESFKKRNTLIAGLCLEIYNREAKLAF
jgi:hypothetical protein